MKKLLSAICLLFICILVVGCAEQTFDDIPYTVSKRSAQVVFDNFAQSKPKTMELNAKYVTTITEKTLNGTKKIQITTLIGEVLNRDCVQIITKVHNGKKYVTESIVTRYEGVEYTEDSDGKVTITNPHLTATIRKDAFDKLFPQINNHTVIKRYDKNFENINYYKLDISINELTSDDEFNYLRPAGSVFDKFNYEIGINEKNSYTQMFRTHSVCKDGVIVDGKFRTVSTRTATTMLTSYGKNKINIIIPEPTVG